LSSVCVVVIQHSNICLSKGKIFNSHVNSFIVVVVRSLKVVQDYWGFVILTQVKGGAKKRTPVFLGALKGLATATYFRNRSL
jgi:hypothetical protein